MGTAEKVAVLITTDSTKRGVFMGFIDPKDADKENIVVEEVRMAVYWSEDMCGVIGLASKGPSKGCRISPAAPKALIRGVTAIMQLTEDAVANWRKEPWSK
jgi:hypothetical protein